MNRETGVFDSWEIQSKTLAIKHCDKSFFEHKGSGVPHEIKWFFNDNGLKAYEKKSITFIYYTNSPIKKQWIFAHKICYNVIYNT